MALFLPWDTTNSYYEFFSLSLTTNTSNVSKSVCFRLQVKKLFLILYSHIRPVHLSCIALQDFPDEILYAFLIFLMYATFPVHVTPFVLQTAISQHLLGLHFIASILLDLITVILSVESVLIVRLPVTQSSATSYSFLAFRPKCSPLIYKSN
jgi:hypothetical protein